jgi:hypothetical protein
MRGEALLAARQGVLAVFEFQKILDHRGIVVSDPIGALAHLQLAMSTKSSIGISCRCESIVSR